MDKPPNSIDITVRALEALDKFLPHGYGEAVLIMRDGTKRVLTHYDPEVEAVREAIYWLKNHPSFP